VSDVAVKLRQVPFRRLPVCPSWVGEPEREVWDQVCRDYELSPDALVQLEVLVGALQRWREARAILDVEGLMIPGRYEGTERVHPLVKVEQDARQQASRAAIALGLEGAPDPHYVARGRR
jgi:phage terminase small subunit